MQIKQKTTDIKSGGFLFNKAKPLWISRWFWFSIQGLFCGPTD